VGAPREHGKKVEGNHRRAERTPACRRARPLRPACPAALGEEERTKRGVAPPPRAVGGIWLILPVVICFVQGLSHAYLSANGLWTVDL
jgi:hypothetical protein